jgi:peptide/nickel transport system permease protein
MTKRSARQIRSGRQARPARQVRFPAISAAVFAVVAGACVLSPLWDGAGSARMAFDALDLPPSAAYPFGTDTLGRNIFDMIWHGGRVSIFIGLLATAVSTLIATVYGAVSGLTAEIVDSLMMRFVEILLSIPSILYVISIQAILGEPTWLSVSVVIGLTSWMNVAKMVRAEVLRVRRSEYVLSARQMGGGFLHIFARHLVPNFVPAVMFMVVYNIGQAIATEATLSFLGIGLPPSVVSWGSLMALSEKALLSGSWWIIVIPGFFLVLTLVCITNLGEYYRRRNNIRQTWL